MWIIRPSTSIIKSRPFRQHYLLLQDKKILVPSKPLFRLKLIFQKYLIAILITVFYTKTSV